MNENEGQGMKTLVIDFPFEVYQRLQAAKASGEGSMAKFVVQATREKLRRLENRQGKEVV